VKAALDKIMAAIREVPLAYHLAQLRHAYTQLKAGTVKDQPQFADGLIAPAIRELERLADQQSE
jgi:hypothetical protein